MLGKYFRWNAAISIPVLLLGIQARAEPIYDNGPPNRAGGSASEMTHWIQADDFTLPAGGRLKSVKFWAYEGSGTFHGSILWQIYANADSNTPGALLESGSSANLSHVATGFDYFGYPEFETTFDIAPVSLPAGMYWIALHNGPLSNNTNQGRVYWGTTGNAGAVPSRGLKAPFDGSWFSHAFPGYFSEFAFELSGVPGARVTAFTTEDGVPQITFTTTAGQYYRVEYKNNLTDAMWTAVRDRESVPGTGNTVQVSDPDVGNPTHRLYRVVLL